MTIGLLGTVSAGAAQKVKLSNSKKTLYAGETFSLELKNAKGDVKWSSSNTKNATVSDGKVTAVKNGKATITAKDLKSGKSYKCKLTIKKNAISSKSLKLKAGESAGLTLKGKTEAEWSSSDESVAYVSNGTVTGVSKGSAKITATVGKKKYTCKVTVSDNKALTSDPIDIDIWVIGDQDIYNHAITELKSAYPNINANIRFFENEEYKQKIRLDAMAGALPDIFYTWTGSFLGEFVDLGEVYCSNDVIKKYVSNGDITKVMLKNCTYDGKYYGVPLYMNSVVMYSNMDLLKKAGYKSVPKTFEDLLKCCEELVNNGITPFGCAGSETWCITEYLESIIEKNIGADALNSVFAGESSFDDPSIEDSVDLFKKMIAKGYFNNDIANASNDDVSGRFYDGEFAFYVNGSWNCGWFSDDPEFASKLEITEFPVFDSKKANSGMLIGGPADGLAVSVFAKNPEITSEYAVALAKIVSKQGYLRGNGLPAWKISYDDSSVNSLTKTVAKMLADAKGLVLYGDTAIKDKDTYLRYVQSIISDDIDGNAFIKGVSKDIIK